MVALVDADGRVLYVNGAVRRFSNRPIEQLVGENGFSFLHPADLERVREQFASVLRSPLIPAFTQVRVRCKGGVHRLFDIAVINHLNDTVGAIVVNAKDVTEAHEHEAEGLRAAAQLEASEKRFRTVAGCVTDLIYDWHVDTGEVQCFGPVDAYLGYAAGTVSWTREAWANVIHPEDRPRVLARLEQAVESGELFEVEYRVRRADGVELIWLDRGRLVSSGEGDRRFVGAVSDLTEHRALQAQLLRSQKMEAIGGLAGGIAHDFNNILTIIIGNTALVAHDPQLSEESREAVADIDAAAARAARLTQQLLAFARQQVLHRRVLDVNEVVADSERMLRRVLGEQIRISTSTRSGPLLVFADATQLEQVLLNLAINARDAMPEGGTLVIRTDVAVAGKGSAGQPREAPPGEYVTMAVEDSGSGMPDDVRSRIFEPFFTTKGMFGTGLGLATAYGIVRQSGGFLECDSAPDRGSTFTIWLPCLPQPAG